MFLSHAVVYAYEMLILYPFYYYIVIFVCLLCLKRRQSNSAAADNRITPYRSDWLMIFRSSSSTSSVGIPSERRIFRNSFIPLINRLHSKSVSFSLVFLLNIKMTSLYLVIPFNTYVFCRMCGIRHLYQSINLFWQNSLDILISMLYTSIVVNVMLNARKPV